MKRKGTLAVALGLLVLLTGISVSAPSSFAIPDSGASQETPVPAGKASNPPIPVHFTLDAPAYVTLVIDDAQGNRVRNLISDTLFPAGASTVWWDGTDDLGRNPDAATHGVYLIPTHFVAPGQYQVHGLSHKAIDLHYEFSVYNAGYPAWETADHKGGWLTNHSSPQAALFVPADKAPGGKPLVYLGSYVSEGGAGMAWVDLDGHKQGGKGWIGGSWTGAPYMARDAGAHANPAVFAYVASVWGDNSRDPKVAMNVDLRLTALSGNNEKPILKYPFAAVGTPEAGESVRQGWTHQISGLAVYDNLAVVSLTHLNQLLFVDAMSGKTLGPASVEDPRGVAFDAKGNLLVLSGKRLLRFELPRDPSQLQQLPQPQVLISQSLEDPAGLTLDDVGNFYISDHGASHKIKVFSPGGKPLRTIGHAGPPQAGPYDPLHMNNPRGLAIDSNHHLWVAEEDFQPKRVSVWTLDGTFVKAFYGPPEYGGGGALDPKDKTRFYYHSMEFKLDWKTVPTRSLPFSIVRQRTICIRLPTAIRSMFSIAMAIVISPTPIWATAPMASPSVCSISMKATSFVRLLHWAKPMTGLSFKVIFSRVFCHPIPTSPARGRSSAFSLPGPISTATAWSIRKR